MRYVLTSQGGFGGGGGPGRFAGAGGVGGSTQAPGAAGDIKNDINIVQNFYGNQNPLEFRRLMDNVSRDLADRVTEVVGGSP